jgi:hypothetical protein
LSKINHNNRNIGIQNGIKIKLSFDGKNVSDTKIQLLNSPFNVINDELHANNVTNTFMQLVNNNFSNIKFLIFGEPILVELFFKRKL